ncbi:MAG TPA: hypothetical protein VNO35_14975 [Steroidobacteraceae bacterium]|nr:hypothetical protein [Steroidobacteraceae bacterium]
MAAAEHNIDSNVETITIGQFNEACARVQRSDVHYRFVIDMSHPVLPLLSAAYRIGQLGHDVLTGRYAFS